MDLEPRSKYYTYLLLFQYLQTEAEARDAWLKKTRNSPAQKSGAWAGEEHKLWEQSLKGGANKGRVFADSIKDDKLIESPLLKASNR